MPSRPPPPTPRTHRARDDDAPAREALRRLPPPRAIVFDLDGTLIDSRADIARACNVALAALGRAAQPVEQVATYVGDGARALMARALDAPRDDALVDRGLAHFRAAYDAHPVVETRLMPGAEACLAHFAALPLAVATNKPRHTTNLVLEALGISDLFRAVAGGGDAPLKPDPSLLLRVLEEMGVPASAAWMIGDSPQDVDAGRAAGCTTLAVCGFVAVDRLVASSPDVLLPALTALPALLE